MTQHKGTSGDLFSSLALPPAYDGELLYSWCARFHRLSCNIRPRDTSQQLFGHPSSGIHHDFPVPLGWLLSRTGTHIGTQENLLLQRTLFGFYRPFLPEARAAALRQAILGGGHTEVHSALGLAASLPSFAGRLKACLECIKEDIASLPTSWWRTEHQWPGAFMCQRHQKPLLCFQDSLERSGEKWILPQDVEAQRRWINLPELTPTQQFRLEEITEWCRLITTKPDIQLETTRLRYCYLTEAEKRGYVALDGSVRLARLRDDFLNWIGDCVHWPGLSFVGDVQDVNAGFLGQLLRSYPGIRHPLKHIVMMAYLFPTTEAFFARYKEVAEIYDRDGERRTIQKLTNLGKDLLRLVGEENISVNSAANKLGVPVTQATQLLKKFNTPYLRKPRIVGTGKEDILVQALRAGKRRAEICRELGLRNGFIKDYLADRPELRLKWELMHTARLKQEYRDRFLKVLAENPTLPIKAIRRLPGNGFQWLYNNDRGWLREILPAIWKR